MEATIHFPGADGLACPRRAATTKAEVVGVVSPGSLAESKISKIRVRSGVGGVDGLESVDGRMMQTTKICRRCRRCRHCRHQNLDGFLPSIRRSQPVPETVVLCHAFVPALFLH